LDSQKQLREKESQLKEKENESRILKKGFKSMLDKFKTVAQESLVER
jgi:hypothetical protein